MKHKAGSAIYNSNNQKIAEPQLSSRNNNVPALNHFAGSINNASGQATILSELPVPTNLQKSGEVPHSKVDRQNSFVLHGKRSGTAATLSHKLAS